MARLWCARLSQSSHRLHQESEALQAHNRRTRCHPLQVSRTHNTSAVLPRLFSLFVGYCISGRVKLSWWLLHPLLSFTAHFSFPPQIKPLSLSLSCIIFSSFSFSLSLSPSSAGVGRTGTLVTIQCMMQMLEDGGEIDIFNFVLNMRHQRNYMVQTEVGN